MKRFSYLLTGTICCALPTPSIPDELGRLLLTPEQRTQREHEAHQQGKDGAGPGIVNGQIVSTHGGRTRWIDGRPDKETTRHPVTETLIQPAAGQADEMLLRGGHIRIRTGTQQP